MFFAKMNLWEIIVYIMSATNRISDDACRPTQTGSMITKSVLQCNVAYINSLAPVTFNKVGKVVSKFILAIDGWDISREIYSR